MSISRNLFIILFFSFVSCSQSPHDSFSHSHDCSCDTILKNANQNFGRGALLGSRFHSLDELKSVIQIEYFNNNSSTDTTIHSGSKVCLSDCSNGKEVMSELQTGISQGDFKKAKEGTYWDKISMLIKSPYAVSHRKELEKVFMLARRMTDIFGEGDQAFYFLAEACAKNINTPDLAFINDRDSSEKGYINTFNHITSQAFITSCFTEELADFVGDSHERFYHPKLILGKFSEKEISDLSEGPVDNYVDLVNNEWGQELGIELKEKYNINENTYWSPELLANYLNDLQSYFSWAFQIGFNPFSSDDEAVTRFSDKLNMVLTGTMPLKNN